MTSVSRVIRLALVAGLALVLLSLLRPSSARAADAAPAPQPQPLRRIAILVGANDPPPDRPRLRFAHDDAREVARVLESVGGFASSDLHVLLDPPRATLFAALDEVARTVADLHGNVLFVFYYSGHSDGQVLFPHGEPVSVVEVRDRVERLGARIRVGILDTCRGGSWTQSKGLTVGPPLSMADLLNTDTEGTALMSSSSGLENAHEADSVKGSFFTHYLTAGLRGAADLRGDGNITLQEAFEYAREHTVRDSALVARTPQHPSFDIALRGRQDIVLALLSARTSALSVTVQRGPFEIIQLASGATVADAPPSPAPLRIALSPGHYLVRTVTGGRVYAKEVTVVPGSTVTVVDGQMEAANDGPLAMKGREPIEAPLSLWNPPRGTHWLLGLSAGLGGDATPPSNVYSRSGAQPSTSFTGSYVLWYRITERLAWSVPWPALTYRLGVPGVVEVMPYVGLAGLGWNSNTGFSLAASATVSARIWTARNQHILLGAGLQLPAYHDSASSLDHLGLGDDLDPFVSAGYGITLKRLVFLSVDGELDREYQVHGGAGPGGYQAEWFRLGAEVDVRLARNVGVLLRGAWSDELHGGSSSYPGFLLGTKIAF